MSTHDAYLSTADRYAEIVAGIRDEQWGGPGLGEWDVRALVGHTSRALTTLAEYLAEAAPADATFATAEAYFEAAFSRAAATKGASEAANAAIAQRGVDAGAALGDDPLAYVRAERERVVTALEEQPAGRIVAVRGGSMPLAEYLRTRLFEITVHTLDIAKAVDVDAALPPGAIRECAELAAGIAAATGRGEQLLLALTGRAPLPAHFSVV